jgi:hypothetical protein
MVMQRALRPDVTAGAAYQRLSRAYPGFDQLGTAEASLWAQRLKRAERPCGCKSGAALMLAAFFGWPAWIIYSGIPHEIAGIATALLFYIPIVLISAVVGKLAGIIVGQLRYRHLLFQFTQRLSDVASKKDN